MTQNKIAPTTMMMRIPITSEIIARPHKMQPSPDGESFLRLRACHAGGVRSSRSRLFRASVRPLSLANPHLPLLPGDVLSSALEFGRQLGGLAAIDDKFHRQRFGFGIPLTPPWLQLPNCRRPSCMIARSGKTSL